MRDTSGEGADSAARDELARASGSVVAGLGCCVTLAEIALKHGNYQRAAAHVVGALADLAPLLAVLRAATRHR